MKNKLNFSDQQFLESLRLSAGILKLGSSDLKIIIVIFCNILQMENNLTVFLNALNVENIDNLFYNGKCEKAQCEAKKYVDIKYHGEINDIFTLYSKQNRLRNDICHGRFAKAQYCNKSIFLESTVIDIIKDMDLMKEKINCIKIKIEVK